MLSRRELLAQSGNITRPCDLVRESRPHDGYVGMLSMSHMIA
jgi:hypothetical protein